MMLKELSEFMNFISSLRLLLLNLDVVTVVQWKCRLVSILHVLYHWDVVRYVRLPTCYSVAVVVVFQDMPLLES